MFEITVTIHAKSAMFGTLGEVIESSSFTTEDSRWGQFATFGDHLARPAAARLDLGGSRGSYAGGGTRSFSFDRGTVVIVATEIEAPAAEAVTVEAEAEIESALQAAGPLVTAAGLPVCYSREDAAALHSSPAAAAKCPNVEPMNRTDAEGRPVRDSTCRACGRYLTILSSGVFRQHAPRFKSGSPRIADAVAGAEAAL